MLRGLNRAKALIEKAIEDPTDIMHSQSLEFAKKLIEKEIDSIPNCTKCKHALYNDNNHENLWCDYHDYKVREDFVCCAYDNQ